MEESLDRGRQVAMELNFLENAVNRTTELTLELENKLQRIMMPDSKTPTSDEESKFEEVCEIATIIRQAKEKITETNGRLSSMIIKIEL